jgi:hypothetical protein
MGHSSASEGPASGKLIVKVVPPRMLYRMKRDTIRLRDRLALLSGAPLMPVRKFRSVEEMGVPRWRAPGDPDLLRAMAERSAKSFPLLGIQAEPRNAFVGLVAQATAGCL